MRPIQLMVVVYVWFCETYKRVGRHWSVKKEKALFSMVNLTIIKGQ